MLCREDGSRKPVRLTFVVFKAEGAADDQWDDDPMLGNIEAEVLGDGDEEVSPVSMVNLGMEPSDFIQVTREDEQEIVFDINFPDGEVRIDKARLEDDGFVLKKEDFGDEGIACQLLPDEGTPFTIRLVVPYVGFSLTDADGNLFRYEIAGLETLSPTAVSEMTASGWELTLFTCTLGGQARLAVRCTLLDTVPAQ